MTTEQKVEAVSDEITMKIQKAIETSQIEDRRIEIKYQGDSSAFMAEVWSIDDDADHAFENDGSLDVWGVDWRLAVTLTS